MTTRSGLSSGWRPPFAGAAREVPPLLQVGEGEYGEGDEFVGVRMGQVFALAKEFIEMPRTRSRAAREPDP